MESREILALILLFLFVLSYTLNRIVLNRQTQEREQDGDGEWM